MKKILFFGVALVMAMTASAQEITSTTGYHRSSLFVMPVVHAQDSFAAEILYAAENLPFPNRYNDARKGAKATVIRLDDHSDYKTVKDTARHNQFDEQLASDQVAKAMVKYWFNFDEKKGFNTDRLTEEGMYDASELKKELAQGTIDGVVNLADAGDELIGKTFVLVNDISYINHAERAAYASAVMEAISAVGKDMQSVGDELSKTNTGFGLFDAAMGIAGAASSIAGAATELVGDLTKTVNELLDIKGFAVCEITYLYQLDWSEDVQNAFYSKYYTEDGDKAKIKAFLADKETFRLKYVGMMPTITNNATAFNAGAYSKKAPSEQIFITCSRTMDDAINTLQTRFPEFRVYTPISEIVTNAKGKTIGVRADIGMKEGVTAKKKYVIREMVLKNGKTEYKDVVTVKANTPIWDNRFAAAEDEPDAEAQAQNGTTFKTNKANLYKGLLLIEK